LNRAATPVVAALRDAPRDARYLAISDATTDLELLARFERLEAVWVNGANTQTLASLIHAPRLRAISLQSTKVDSVAMLAGLAPLEHLSVCDGRRLSSVRELAGAPALRTLLLWNVPHFTDLESLGLMSHLIGLQLGGAMWRTQRLSTLAPLSHLARLRYLDLPATRAETDSLQPLAALTELRDLSLPNVYPIEQFAALAASLPNASGDCLRSHWRGTLACAACGSSRLLETGRGGRFVCPQCAPERIAKRAAKFEELVSRGGFTSLNQAL
jgi:hypothetical protein